MSEIINNEDEDYDLKEKAVFYLNLLKNDLSKLEKFFQECQESIDVFLEDAISNEVS